MTAPPGLRGGFSRQRRSRLPLVTGIDPASSTPHAPLHAGGWARTVTCPGGLSVAGAAHLVAATDGAAGLADPLVVIAEAYRRYGLDAFARLRGTFCIALYDSAENRMMAAVDHFATRPLYFTEDVDGVVFGASLAEVATATSAIDPQAILEYLLFTTVPTPRTVYAGVHKLAAGQVLVADDSGVRTKTYWDVRYPATAGGTPQSWARDLRAQIERSICDYVAAEDPERPLGAFLSGGTDSSTVAGVIRRVAARPLATFSIGYAEPGYDEMSYARTSAEWFGTQQHEWRLSAAEALDLVPRIAAHYEEPFGNSSALPTYRCAQLAREHGVEVLFAGDGGDEIFAGNERYASAYLFELYQRLPRELRRMALDPFFARIPDELPLFGKAARYVRRSNLASARRFYSYGLLLSEPLDSILAPEFLAAVDPQQLLAPAEAHDRRLPPETAWLNRLMYLDLKLAIVDNDVRKVSGMAELAGISVRYPLLDVDLVDFAARIPVGLKMRGPRKRYVFKQALADFLPPAVLRKKKHGFGTPIALWMKCDAGWRSFVGDLVHDARTRQRGYVSPAFLDRYWQQVQAGNHSYYGDTLWPFLMLELWQRAHASARATRPERAVAGAR